MLGDITGSSVTGVSDQYMCRTEAEVGANWKVKGNISRIFLYMFLKRKGMTV